MLHGRTGSRLDGGGCVGVSVRVDADDVVGLPCQHGHRGSFLGLMGRHRPGAVTGRQDCDEARPERSATLLIRPAISVGQAGAGDRDDKHNARARGKPSQCEFRVGRGHRHRPWQRL